MVTYQVTEALPIVGEGSKKRLDAVESYFPQRNMVGVPVCCTHVVARATQAKTGHGQAKHASGQTTFVGSAVTLRMVTTCMAILKR